MSERFWMRFAFLQCMIYATYGIASCDADAPSATLQEATRAEAAKDSSPSPSAFVSRLRDDSIASRWEPNEEAIFFHRLVAAAIARTRVHVNYDPSYVALSYPMGDVANDRGVCADVVVRAYRAVGVDLQERMHEDMSAAFDAYPSEWGLSRPDPNIDHRRVLNIETFLARRGAELERPSATSTFKPGDLVTYRVEGHLPHIAVVADRRGRSGGWMIVHNIGRGPQIEDALLDWPLSRHFRWAPEIPPPATP